MLDELKAEYRSMVKAILTCKDPNERSEFKAKKSLAVDAMFKLAASLPDRARRREARHDVKQFLQTVADELLPVLH
jgi:hypothetical protein